MFKKSYIVPLLLVVAMLLGGYAGYQRIDFLGNQVATLENQVVTVENEVATWESFYKSRAPLSTALRAIRLIKEKDLTGLSALVHPTKGLRFTPYPHVDLKTDKVFTAQQVAGLAADTTVYQWGEYDGTGDPIKLSYNDYYRRFVYDHEFDAAPMIAYNHAIGTGNTIDNVQQTYPNGKFVEFYFPGFDPQYQGIDWSSLKLVFEQQDGTWYLVGIVHGQWTI